jgi:FixJ family two-component response regulator
MNKFRLKDSDGCEEKTSEGPLVSIVDDDFSVGRSMQRLLRSFGFRAAAFTSAEDFLQSGRAGETDCLLLDVRMPGMDGLELQRRLGETNRQIPIIFLSARASEEEQRRALRAGAADFLRKPASRETLLWAILSALKIQPINQEKNHGQDHDRTRNQHTLLQEKEHVVAQENKQNSKPQ